MTLKLNERLLIAKTKKALKKLSVIQNGSLKASFDLLCHYCLKKTIQNLLVVYNCENENQEMKKKALSKSGWEQWRWLFCRNTSLIRYIPVIQGFSQAQQGIWTVIKLLSLAIKKPLSPSNQSGSLIMYGGFPSAVWHSVSLKSNRN